MNDDPAAKLAIRSIGTNAIPFLIIGLKAKDSPPRKAILRLMEHLHVRALPMDSAVRRQFLACAGFEALGSTGRTGIPSIARLLNDRNTSGAASFALAAIGMDGMRVLSEALTNHNIEIRCAIVTGLGNAHDDAKVAATILTNAIQDPNYAVRASAARGLGRLGSEPSIVVPALIEATADPSKAVRQAALEALGELGKAASTARDTICRATNDPDLFVRNTALSSLMKIRD